MGRRRKAGNTGYPAGVYPSRGWLFYRDRTTGDWHKVCRIEEWAAEHPGSKAARTRYAELSTGKAAEGTIAAFLDWELDHREQLVREGKLDKRTLEDNGEYCVHLKAVFGSMLPHQVNGRHIAGYLEKRSFRPRPRNGVEQAPRRAPVRANKEISLLSATYTRALTSPDWPLVTSNPCHGVKRNPTKRRERCPELWEIEAAKQKARGAWPLIFDFAYKCGQRGVQTRLLPKTAIKVGGISVPPAKGGNPIFIEWDDELIAVVLGLLEYTAEIERKLHITSPYIIASRTGAPYTPHGWKTIMYKIVRAAIADPENQLEEPFSFHDFRARSATDEEELYGTSPQDRLGHKRRATTDIYMRGRRERRVKPLPLRKAS
jgi:integrase